MIFIGYQDGMKGYVFMRPSNNSIVKATTALFDETLFPKCPESQRRGFTPVGEIPNGTPPNIPSEDSSDDEDFPSRKSDSYDLPSKGGNSSRDDDNVPPPPAPPQDPPSDHDDHSDPPTPGDENEDNNELPRCSVIVNHQTRVALEGGHDHAHEGAVAAAVDMEGRVEFMNFLLSKSIPNHEPLPQHSEVKEWTFQDIARLPASQQKEWKTACKEELEALRK
ncbi:hypothetical protein MPER_11041 [Moniliophthora perniciosa FA553]|nr:hypothetical protein MPER_11041 [Moniliophthora perniciosa FA553]